MASFTSVSFPYCCGYYIVKFSAVKETDNWETIKKEIDEHINTRANMYTAVGHVGRVVLVVTSSMFSSLGGEKNLPKFSDVVLIDKDQDLILINFRVRKEVLPQ